MPRSLAAAAWLLAFTCALAAKDTLRCGETLRPGRALISANGFHYLSFDRRGRPLLWAKGRGTFEYFWVPLWVAPIPGVPSRNVRLALVDGNELVLYGPQEEVLWSSGTAGQGDGKAQLTVTDDGELRLCAGADCLWKSQPNICWDRRRRSRL